MRYIEMIDDRKLSHIGSVGDIDIYEFKARLFRYSYLYMAEYEKNLSHKIRITLSYLRGGYRIFYLARNKTIVASGTIEKGGGRYKFCSNEDLILCSLWVAENSRGKGIGRLLVKSLIKIAENDCKGDIYEYIHPNNIASITLALDNGFIKKGSAKTIGLFKKMVETDNGTMDIYRKPRLS